MKELLNKITGVVELGVVRVNDLLLFCARFENQRMLY